MNEITTIGCLDNYRTQHWFVQVYRMKTSKTARNIRVEAFVLEILGAWRKNVHTYKVWYLTSNISIVYGLMQKFNNTYKRTMNFTPYSVEITNKMQPCNRIYYSTVHWRLNMFRAAYRSLSGALTLTNLFKQTNIKIALKSNNTISQIFRPKATNSTPIYNKSGIYKLTFKTCQHVYVGQTSRNLKQRYQEHVRYIKNNDPESAFAQHILNNQHEYGTIEEIMKLHKPTNHTSMLIPYELFFIQSHHQHGQLISERNPGELNPLIQLGLDAIDTRDYLINNNRHDT